MTTEVESCGAGSSFAYSPMVMESTLLTEFDLVCDTYKKVVRAEDESQLIPGYYSGVDPFVLIFFHSWLRPRQPFLWLPL